MKTKRIEFYKRIDEFWPDLYGEAYALFDVLLMSDKEKQKIAEASWRVGKLFFKTATILRNLDDATLITMSYPKEALAFIKMAVSLPESVIARIDFVEHEGTYKVMELNADTPTFIKELFHVNRLVCKYFNYEDVNHGEEARLKEAVHTAITTCIQTAGTADPYVVFTAHQENVEDRFTALYLQKLYQGKSSFVPLEELQIIEGEGLFDESGRKIDILYRQTFPIESLLLDRDTEGNPIGHMLLQLVLAEKLQLINPPSAFLLQNKAVQAVIWGLYEERHPFFTEEEHRWIAEYMLPTYLEADFFLEKGMPYVKKPTFGREGDTVEIYNKKGKIELADAQQSYADYGFIYQQYIELPKVEVDVNGERRQLHKMFGSFLLQGAPSAIGCRVGGKITNNLSYYLPIGIPK
ncbi:glutathionylspermidine synthase family protein [Ectobacillus sp. JY-23]|uniref:glutathionylspermidine synthase family protein n=1 Tax=Ectobacillus sp. JY-23 TaxID=2933872 RepID=UPI001FF5C082|nr:glutathionylspermidine synthase family protein [Ectobacillus sp. JY-23]UOY93836.1 glutathionylspermidine synthase family protein [Ectobacillus sp. JY-23]